MSEWNQKALYATDDGDRVTLLELDGQWAISWSSEHPRPDTQVVEYGPHGGKAVQVFIDSREGKTLTFDSREQWQNGSV
ncbi:hypothetical protein ACFYXS_02695 [Streptomyces sp. NPDC002574]|uniref:hypothetical protein n=1 Tax=Streptomyces sp. NPDC002574 TaxID=3364652 RepID=UPI0036BA0BA7